MSMVIESFKIVIYSIIKQVKHNEAARDTDVGSQLGSLTSSCTSFYGSRMYTVIQKYYECQHIILGSLFVTRWTHSSSSPMYWGRFGAFPRIPDDSWESSGRRGALFLPPAWVKGGLHALCILPPTVVLSAVLCAPGGPKYGVQFFF